MNEEQLGKNFEEAANLIAPYMKQFPFKEERVNKAVMLVEVLTACLAMEIGAEDTAEILYRCADAAVGLNHLLADDA